MCMRSPPISPEDDSGTKESIGTTLAGVLTTLPRARVTRAADPRLQVRSIADAASRKAAITAASLALPPGPLGWFTILPEVTAIWKIQTQMVADIAGAYGQEATLTREHMLYCLFRHTAVQALRDVVVRVGGRVLVQQVSLRLGRVLTARFGVVLARRSIARGVSRLVPVVGAIGVGAYAFFDTAQVARAAQELFDSADGSAGGGKRNLSFSRSPLEKSMDGGFQ
jgi:hypothetical protein